MPSSLIISWTEKRAIPACTGRRGTDPRPIFGWRLTASMTVAVCFLFCSSAALTDPAQVDPFRSPSEGILSMRLDQGKLSLEAREAPFERLLQELSRLGGLKILSDGPLEGRITLKIENVNLDTAMRKILRGKDVTFLYAASKDRSTGEGYVLKEVRIYLPESKEPGGRLYSYAKPSPSRPSPRPPSRHRIETREEESPEPPPPTPRPPLPNLPSQEEAEHLVSGLMEGNIDQLDEMVERLREENPQAQDQIDRFLDSLEDAKEKARESGRPFQPMENLGELGVMMEQMMKTQAAPAPSEEPEEP